MTANPEGSILGPRIHQELIARLIYGLSRLHYEQRSGLFPDPETMIDEGQTSPVPDIMLIDKASGLTQVIIEIAHTQGVKKDSRKLQELMADYEVPEGFVYDCKQNRWLKFQHLQENPSDSACCDALGIDLAALPQAA